MSMQDYDYNQVNRDQEAGDNINESITGLIDTIIFRNEINGYTVCGIDSEFDFIAVGVMPELEEGDHVKLHGAWIRHPEYGQQFKVSNYEPVMPESAQGIIAYLSSGLIKGIGPGLAKRLVREFGTDTLEVLANDPKLAAKVKGISARLAESVAEQLRDKRQYQELVMLLSPYGIGPARIMKIFRKWGITAAQKIRSNPWLLAEEIEGTGFLTADRIAQGMGISRFDEHRLENAILFWLNRYTSSGHTWCSQDEMIEGSLVVAAIDKTTDNRNLLNQAIDRLISYNRLVRDNFIALPHIFQSELACAERMALLNNCSPQRFPDWQDNQYVRRELEAMQAKQELSSFRLTSEQINCLTSVISSNISVLTGGPGTGKTTVIKSLCEFIKQEGGRVLLAAPTGRAARRLSEATGETAATLHRLLAIPVGRDGQLMDQSQVNLQADFIVVDEASMLDVFVFRSLLSAIPPGTRLLLTGDIDQLPSVGPGQILRDITASDQIPVLRLTQIFRQAAQSLIVKNAYNIRNGDFFKLDQSFDSSFIWISRDNVRDMADAVIGMCGRVLPDEYQLDPVRDLQVLTPVRKSECGASELNKKLQQILNPASEKTDSESGLNIYGKVFLPGDKVIQLRNQYELNWESINGSEKGQGVMNGETGIVIEVNKSGRSLKVLFDDERQACYSEELIEDLDLAYAMTVHKSQGSEYPAVLLVLPPTAPSLLNRQLLYTAVTRAKTKLFIISSKDILKRAIANDMPARRKTLLESLLRSEM